MKRKFSDDQLLKQTKLHKLVYRTRNYKEAIKNQTNILKVENQNNLLECSMKGQNNSSKKQLLPSEVTEPKYPIVRN